MEKGDVTRTHEPDTTTNTSKGSSRDQTFATVYQTEYSNLSARRPVISLPEDNLCVPKTPFTHCSSYFLDYCNTEVTRGLSTTKSSENGCQHFDGTFANQSNSEEEKPQRICSTPMKTYI
ncbi:hypothetical protein CRM22_007408 [Opisthorchis felineus]|uniref:Uncharacterized protein n=1 Tax=Opisthorchis felineus TaxID=147828 RepID=A0A4S2LNV4_OPIFE|nr:hypothetical protein CRM22_007408 [Opisthorchis felineus]